MEISKSTLVLVISIAMIILIVVLGCIFIAPSKNVKIDLNKKTNIVENKTTEFLGEKESYKDIEMGLDDMTEPLGTWSVLVSGSGLVSAQYMGDQGDKVARYEFSLTADEIQKFINLFIINDFVDIKVVDRQGVPDEGRAQILLTSANKEKQAMFMWVRDLTSSSVNYNERFVNILNEMKVLKEKAKTMEPTYLPIVPVEGPQK